MRYGVSCYFIILCIIVVFFHLCGATPVGAEAAPIVMLIDLQGNHHIPDEKVLGEISSSRLGQPLSERAILQDMRAIRELGFFAAVRYRVEKVGGGVKLIFILEENPVVKVVRITGLAKAKDEDVRPLLEQETGEVFNRSVLHNDIDRVKKECQNRYGLLVEAGSETISADGVLVVRLVEVRLGKIKITGLKKTKAKVVRREMSLSEGDVINQNVMNRDYWKIARLNIFESIVMRLEPGSTPFTQDLVVEVVEHNTGAYSIGIGYSENNNDLAGIVSITNHNFRGLGQSIGLDLDYSQSARNIQCSFTDPELGKSKLRFSTALWNNDSARSTTMQSWGLGSDSLYDMDLTRTGCTVGLGREVWNGITANLTLTLEQDTVDQYRKYKTGHDSPGLSLDALGDLNRFWDNSLGVELVRDRQIYRERCFVDEGYRIYAGYTVAGSAVGGEWDYQRMTWEGKWFHKFSSRWVGGVRLRSSRINGVYPDYDQLYLGGMFTMRGYEDHRYSDDTTRALIGSSYLLANLELRYHPVCSRALEGVAFYDAGQIRDTGAAPLKFDYGLGLRYDLSFLGLLRLDRAWNGDGGSLWVISINELF